MPESTGREAFEGVAVFGRFGSVVALAVASIVALTLIVAAVVALRDRTTVRLRSSGPMAEAPAGSVLLAGIALLGVSLASTVLAFRHKGYAATVGAVGAASMVI